GPASGCEKRVAAVARWRRDARGSSVVRVRPREALMHWDYYGQRWVSDPPSRVASNVAESSTPSVDAQGIAAYGLQLPIIWRTQVSDGQDDPDFTGRVAQIYGAGAFPPESHDDGGLLPQVSESLSWGQANSAPTTATQGGPVTIMSTGRA